MGKLQTDFLLEAAAAARASGHIYPEYAACEAALESAWGQSRLAREANNLFGQKQAHPPLAGTGTFALPTREFLHGAWVEVPANWVHFPDWASCFRARMAVLNHLRHAYPQYASALAAATGELFIEDVSVHWSTDPNRARKVLSVFRLHGSCFHAEAGTQAARI